MDLDSEPLNSKETKKNITHYMELVENRDNARRSKNIIAILILAAVQGYLQGTFRRKALDIGKPDSTNETVLGNLYWSLNPSNPGLINYTTLDWIETVAFAFDIIVAIILLLSRRKHSLQNISNLLWFQAVLVFITIFEYFIESKITLFFATYFLRIGVSIAAISIIFLALTYIYEIEYSSLSIIPLIGFVAGIYIFTMSYAISEDSVLFSIFDDSKYTGIFDISYCIGTFLFLLLLGYVLKYLDKPERVAEEQSAIFVIQRLFKNPIWLYNAFSTTLIIFSAARVFSIVEYPTLYDILVSFELKPAIFTLINSLISGLSCMILALILFKCSTNIQIAKVIFDWLFFASFVVMSFHESYVFDGIFYFIYTVFYGLWPVCSAYITFRNVLSQDRAVALGLEFGLAIFITYIFPGKFTQFLYYGVIFGPRHVIPIIASSFFVGLIAVLDIVVLYLLRNKAKREIYLAPI